MDKQKKQELYDELCKALTWYEHPEEFPEYATPTEISDNLYKVAVKIQQSLFD